MINFETFFKVDESNRFGFFIDDHKINFLVPNILKDEVSSFSDVFNKMKILRKYLRVLKNYQKSKINFNDLNFDSVSNDKNIDCIEAMINLLEDLFKNGDYICKSHNLKKSTSKIDWNRTIKKNEIIVKPIHLNNNFNSSKKEDISVIYGSFVSKSNKYNENDLFFQIYKITITKILYLFYGVQEKYECDVSEKLYLSIINKFLNSHFKDREIFIAKQLKVIYGKNNFNKSFENKFELKYHERFEYIFEYMIDSSVKNISIKNKISLNEQGKYFLYDSGKEYRGIYLKMDHIVNKSGFYKILDSKFYDVDSEIPNLPKTSDIIKQVGYKFILSEFLKAENLSIKDISNTFIFPTVFNTEIIGEHYMPHHPNLDSLFDIKCIKVNIFSLMEHFSKNKEYKAFLSIL